MTAPLAPDILIGPGLVLAVLLIGIGLASWFFELFPGKFFAVRAYTMGMI